MNILVDAVRIAGFRGIENLEISLPRIAVFIGTNNSGKTSVLKALQLALGSYSRYIQSEDFYIDNHGQRAGEILVDVRIISADAEWKPIENFAELWRAEFGDDTSFSGFESLIIRTKVIKDEVTGEPRTERFILKEWADFSNWRQKQATAKKMRTRYDAIQIFPIEAQRDIHQELRERSSYISRILGQVEYDEDDKTALEELIKEVNDQAVEKSAELGNLRKHLNNLNKSFQGVGNTEITPFPKNIRDLSKYFSIHFGDNVSNSFPMEYHGMGTRSWASMLTSKAFAEMIVLKHEREAKPIANILVVEEPEGHLHPNAQKTLYDQLKDFKGQVLLSTHSPYLAAMCDVGNIRSLRKTGSGVWCHQIKYKMTQNEKNILGREIWNKRGELLFARALILAEGVTEEQIIPAMFEIFFGFPMYSVGISCVSVDGKNYAPFIKLACSLGIPVTIVSDNDKKTEEYLSQQFDNIKEHSQIDVYSENFSVHYLDAGDDFEANLLRNGFRGKVVDAFVLSASSKDEHPKFLEAQRNKMGKLSNEDLLKEMRDTKAKYAGFLAKILLDKHKEQSDKTFVLPAVMDAFEDLKKWCSL